jgi:hypothetical protein
MKFEIERWEQILAGCTGNMLQMVVIRPTIEFLELLRLNPGEQLHVRIIDKDGPQNEGSVYRATVDKICDQEYALTLDTTMCKTPDKLGEVEILIGKHNQDKNEDKNEDKNKDKNKDEPLIKPAAVLSNTSNTSNTSTTQEKSLMHIALLAIVPILLFSIGLYIHNKRKH